MLLTAVLLLAVADSGRAQTRVEAKDIKDGKAETAGQTEGEAMPTPPPAEGTAETANEPEKGGTAPSGEMPAPPPEPATAVAPASAGSSPAPAGSSAPSQDKFFTDEPRQFRFLEKKPTRIYAEPPSTGPNPNAPPVDIPEQESRRRGDAGAPIAVAVAVEAGWNLDEGFDLFGEDDVFPRVDLWFSYDLFSLTSQLILAGEIGVGSGMKSSSGLFNDMETTLRRTALYAGANLRYVLAPCFQPHLRVAGGYSVTEAQFDFDGDEHYEDFAPAPTGSVGLGFTLRTPTRLFENRSGEFASLSLGVMFEGGYAVTPGASFTLEGENEDRIEVRETDLGELALSGPYFRTSLVVRF
jgi:hypothetical protein